MTITALLPFVPAKDYSRCLSYYQEVGFDIVYTSERISRLRHGNAEFYLQNYYDKGFAENLVLHIEITEFVAFYEHIKSLARRYPECRYTGIIMEAYGTVFRFWGPSGELWDVVDQTTM